MKKLYTLLSVLAISAISMNAQNLVPNGTLENWTNPTTPEDYVAVTSGTFSANNFLAQEADIKHGGSFAASQTSQSSTQVFGNFELPVTPGHSYTISYWYLDNVPNAKSRIWSAWVTGTGAGSSDMTTNADVLHPSTYSADSANWTQVTLTLTAPEGANRFKFQVRTFREAVGVEGGKIYYDDLSFVDNSLSVNQNSIAGLKVYPNPVVNGTLYIDTDASASKAVAIYDVLGKQVVKATTEQTVNVSNLKAGVYIVKITEEGRTATRKLVIK